MAERWFIEGKMQNRTNNIGPQVEPGAEDRRTSVSKGRASMGLHKKNLVLQGLLALRMFAGSPQADFSPHICIAWLVPCF